MAALIAEMQALLTRAISHKPTSQRRQYLLSPILFPVPQTAPATGKTTPTPDEQTAGTIDSAS